MGVKKRSPSLLNSYRIMDKQLLSNIAENNLPGKSMEKGGFKRRKIVHSTHRQPFRPHASNNIETSWQYCVVFHTYIIEKHLNFVGS